MSERSSSDGLVDLSDPRERSDMTPRVLDVRACSLMSAADDHLDAPHRAPIAAHTDVSIAPKGATSSDITTEAVT